MNFENDDNLDYKLNLIASQVIKEKRIKKGYSLEEVVNKLDNFKVMCHTNTNPYN